MPTDKNALITDSGVIDERIADLGYAKQYATALFELMAKEKAITPDVSLKIKEAYEKLRDALVELNATLNQ